MGLKTVLERRPENVIKKLGKSSNVPVISSKRIFDSVFEEDVVLMAANTRIKWVIPGIMRAAKDLNAVVGFELAKSECNLEGGYTGFTPEDFFNTVVEFAERERFIIPFFIHADHTTVKNTSEQEINSTKKLIEEQIKAGYTSFAIDASYNEIDDNIRITSELAKPLYEMEFGIEVEVGEIKSTGQKAELTTKKEAKYYIESLISNGINPNLLAINNGAKHGNYLEGEEVFIDLERTLEIAKTIERHGVRIAQHGTTGTPDNIISVFKESGIRKANIGTLWQNVAHRHFPEEIMVRMKEWSEMNKKDIKFATKEFKKEIDSFDKTTTEKIAKASYEEAYRLIKILGGEDTASLVLEHLK
ncbi:MAG: class II fructose-bisphosphate aldolase [Acidobacteriota bacterium]